MSVEYNDNLIMSPNSMERIAKEYYVSGNTNGFLLEPKVIQKLADNLNLLEYINSHTHNNAFQKLAIQHYGIIKLCKQKSTLSIFSTPKSLQQARQQCLNNCLNIIELLINSNKNILFDLEAKTINLCTSTLSQLI